MKFKMLIITLVLTIDILSKQIVAHTMLEEESINIITQFSQWINWSIWRFYWKLFKIRFCYSCYWWVKEIN